MQSLNIRRAKRILSILSRFFARRVLINLTYHQTKILKQKLKMNVIFASLFTLIFTVDIKIMVAMNELKQLTIYLERFYRHFKYNFFTQNA